MTFIVDGTAGATFPDSSTQAKAGLADGGTIANGTVTTLTTTTISDGTNSTSATNCIKGSAKAWVKYQGGNGNTSGVIVGSYNVSSITTSSAGIWIVNFTNALADANYSATGNMVFTSTTNPGYTVTIVIGTQTASNFYVFGVNSVTGTSTTGQFTNVAVFR